MDTGNLLRRQLGILVTAGKSRADIDMNHSVILGDQLSEKRLIVCRVHRIGGGNSPAGIHVRGNICRGDIHAVLI